MLERKPDRSFVTVADQGIEREIRGRIRGWYPDHGLVGEEYGTAGGDAATRWYIDPIDGTHNFIRGVPLFGTLLAVEHEGEIQAGVISAPAMRQRWWAARGGGRCTATSTVRAPDPRVPRSTVEDAQILYGSRRENVASGVMPGFDALIDAAWRARGFGDFWGYTLLAEGCAEAMLETMMKPWDLAAPQIVIEEAGGRVTDAFGERRIDAERSWPRTVCSTTRSCAGSEWRSRPARLVLPAQPAAHGSAEEQHAREHQEPDEADPDQRRRVAPLRGRGRGRGCRRAAGGGPGVVPSRRTPLSITWMVVGDAVMTASGWPFAPGSRNVRSMSPVSGIVR